jgi:hypothetical protein
MAGGHEPQVAPGAATDLQQRASIVQAQRVDGALAAEQEEPARQVEDVPLVAVFPVHALLVAIVAERERRARRHHMEIVVDHAIAPPSHSMSWVVAAVALMPWRRPRQEKAAAPSRE